MDPLAQLAIMWTSVFFAAVLAHKTRLTPVLFFLFMGAVLVNTGILPHETHPFIRGFADIGIIIIMFALGFEERTVNFIATIKRVWGIALFGALGPFLAAYAVADYFWDTKNVSLLCGLAMASTTVSLTMVSLKSEGLHKTAAARGIMTSAVVDNISSLLLVALLVPLATGETALTPQGVGVILFKVIVFFLIVLFVARWVLPHDRPHWLSRLPVIGQYGIKHVLSFSEGEQSVLTVLLIALLSGLLAHQFGFHPAVGAYLAGLILKEEYFRTDNDPKKDYFDSTKRIIDSVAFSWIGPIFFVHLGTKILFDWEIFVSVIPQTIAMVAGIMAAQIASAALAARYTGGFSIKEALMIGFGMLGRAELAFVVMEIAYTEKSIFTREVFYTLMFTAFWLNVSVPILIKLWKPYFKKS
ncbi:MAG TPA: cation:proton antiporter [Rhodospirillaceae bacterium]|nr:cation:proton antiporter [Rhodospirillaceae bacterium]